MRQKPDTQAWPLREEVLRLAEQVFLTLENVSQRHSPWMFVLASGYRALSRNRHDAKVPIRISGGDFSSMTGMQGKGEDCFASDCHM